MARAEIYPTSGSNQNNFNSAGVLYVVQTNSGVFYKVFIDGLNDVKFIKSSDGLTWSVPVNIFTGTATILSIWYDRWSGIAADQINCAYVESGGHNILHRSIDTASSDALSTETTVFDGASAASNGALTIWRERNGHLRVVGAIDGGTEDGAWSSDDAGATWDDTIADPSEGATNDQYFGLPGWNADTADGMVIFVDASANGLSVKRYDDSGDSWAETAIIADGSFTDLVSSSGFPNVACFVDIANSRNIVVAWTATDAANADLRCFIVTDTTVTETATNVVLNSTDDQGLCAAGIDTATGTWYVFYCGKSDGSETFSSALNVYYKTSTDAGATWSAETLLTSMARAILALWCTPRFSTNYIVMLYHNLSGQNGIVSSALLPISPRARMEIGV